MSSNDGTPKEILDRVRKNQGILSKIASVFPGYGGYKKREQLRGTDDLVRRNLFRTLENASSNLRESYRMAVQRSLIDEAKEIESLYLLCDSLAQSVLHAPRGYKPIGGTASIKEDDLRKLLEFDAALAEVVEAIEKKTDEVRTAILQKDVEGIIPTISALRAMLDELSALMKKRDALLDGFM